MHDLKSHKFTRRNILQTFSGFGLSCLLPGLDSRAAEKRGPERGRSLITIWLAGGPSQLETFDPHPNSKIGDTVKAIPTTIPNLKIAGLYPQLAEQIDCLSVIRSLVSKEGDHERGTSYLKTGYRPDPTTTFPSIGSLYAHEAPNPKLEIPQHVSITGGQWASRGGFLGAEHDAFKIFDPGLNVRNMKPRVSTERQKKRLSDLEIVTQAFQKGRKTQTENTLHQLTVARALEMMNSKQLTAFEITDEPEPVKKAYGDTRFGRGCLVARRLVEQGVRAIEVTLPGWDSHTDNLDTHKTKAAILDPAISTLLRDLKERDLLESTVVLCIGEFGRTPKVNALGGRDHWPTGFSCLLGGSTLHAGRVIGATDPTGKNKDPENPISIPDLYATVMSALGINYAKELMTPIGRPISLSDGKPIPELLNS